MIEMIEFFWDEQTGHSHCTFEHTYTGELTEQTRYQPLAPNGVTWLAPGQDPREKYFSELVTYLKTQDPYGLHSS